VSEIIKLLNKRFLPQDALQYMITVKFVFHSSFLSHPTGSPAISFTFPPESHEILALHAVADPEFSNAGGTSRAPNARVSRRRRCRGVEFGEGCPPPQWGGVWGGVVPPRQNFFLNFLPRNCAFSEHSDTIRQFTKSVAIRLKACRKLRRLRQSQVLVVFH